MTSATGQARDREGKFVGSLIRLKERNDRGALAALRRGLGRSPGEAEDMHKYVVPFLDPHWEEDDWRFYLVASLFATHPEQWPQGEEGNYRRNLGTSFARLLRKRAGGEQGVERRFVALLSASKEDIPEQLRHAISLLKASGVPVDYSRLLADLQWWDHEERRIQRQWARSFWGAGSGIEAARGGNESANESAVGVDGDEDSKE